MRKKEKQITDQTALDDILQRAEVLRLAMCDEGRPYVLPLNFGYSQGRVYIHCAREGRKLDILRRNPNVCFETSVDLSLRLPQDQQDACGYSMNFRCVIGEGRAVILEDPDDVRQGLEVIMRHYAEGPFHYKDKGLAHAAVIRIDVNSLSGKQSLG